MTFAITQNCCSDATCVSVCPVNAIHPTPEERAFGSTEMLHVDPRSCIDCGACADACPIDAIVPVDSAVRPGEGVRRDQRAYYETSRSRSEDTGPNFHPWSQPTFDRIVPSALQGARRRGRRHRPCRHVRRRGPAAAHRLTRDADRPAAVRPAAW